MVGVILNFVLVFTSLNLLGYDETIVTILPSFDNSCSRYRSIARIGTDTITVLFIITTGLIGSMMINVIESR